jgi:hypothetical protein
VIDIDKEKLGKDMQQAFEVLHPAIEKLLAKDITPLAIALQMLAGSMLLFERAEGDKREGVRAFMDTAWQQGLRRKKEIDAEEGVPKK